MLHENSRECSVGFDYNEVDEEPDTSQEEPLFSRADMLEYGRRLISFIRSHDRARLTLDCLYLAMGDAELEQVTMTRIAFLHGITKAAVSKRVRDLRHHLHFSINGNNKSDRARDTYTRTNRSPVCLDKPARRVSGVPARAHPARRTAVR